MRSFVSILIAVLTSASSSLAQSALDTLVNNQSFFAAIDTTRNLAYSEFALLVDSASAPHFGLEDASLIQNATPGDPWIEATISGEQLRGFSGLPVSALFVPNFHVKYPYVNNGRIVGMVVLRVEPGHRATVASYSPGTLASSIQRAKDVISARYGLSTSGLFGVRFPTLHRYFLARRSNSDYTFYSVFGDPDLGLPAVGDEAPAMDVLLQLVTRAQQDPGGSR